MGVVTCCKCVTIHTINYFYQLRTNLYRFLANKTYLCIIITCIDSIHDHNYTPPTARHGLTRECGW